MFGILADNLNEFLGLIAIIISGVSFLVGKWYKTQTTEMKSRGEFRNKIDNLSNEISNMEKEVESVKKDVNYLQGMQQTNQQSIAVMSETIKNIEKKLDMVITFITKKGDQED